MYQHRSTKTSKNDTIYDLPESFFKKEKDTYIFQDQKMLNYIKKNSTHDEFIIIVFIGKSQYGKSTLAKNLTGVKHKIGNTFRSETEGSTIAYGGTIKEIYKRMNVEPLKYPNQDIDVFIIDTEGIFNDSCKTNIASLLMPLTVISSKIITFMSPQPDDSMTLFLSLIQSFLNSTNKKQAIHMFQNKLVVRINDFPSKINNDIDFYTKLFERNSCIAQNFNKESIHPIYVPAGPYDYENRTHYQKFTKNFLDKIFISFLTSENIQNQIVYSSPEKFIEDTRKLVIRPVTQNKMILKLFEEKNVAERILEYICIGINDQINKLYQENIEKMYFDDNLLNSFLHENIECKLKIKCEEHNISQQYFEHYYNLEMNIFKEMKKNLKMITDKYNKIKSQIVQAKNQKEKIFNLLRLLSEKVTDSAQFISNEIINASKYSFFKNQKRKYIDDLIKSQKDYLLKNLQDSNIPSICVIQQIKNDIISIFDKFNLLKDYSFYHQNYISGLIFTKEEERKKISPGFWIVYNKTENRYTRIIIESRIYDVKFADIIKSDIENDVLCDFCISDYSENFNMTNICHAKNKPKTIKSNENVTKQNEPNAKIKTKSCVQRMTCDINDDLTQYKKISNTSKKNEIKAINKENKINKKNLKIEDESNDDEIAQNTIKQHAKLMKTQNTINYVNQNKEKLKVYNKNPSKSIDRINEKEILLIEQKTEEETLIDHFNGEKIRAINHNSKIQTKQNTIKTMEHNKNVNNKFKPNYQFYNQKQSNDKELYKAKNCSKDKIIFDDNESEEQIIIGNHIKKEQTTKQTNNNNMKKISNVNLKEPKQFYLKEKENGEIKYAFNENEALNYIKKNSIHDEFIIIVFIGKSQYGKSTLAKNLTGVKHKIGNTFRSETEGSTIAYGGTIKEIYKRMNVEPLKYPNQDIDVFIIDTEGLYTQSNQTSIASLLLPHLIFSSKIVTFSHAQPDDSISNFLSISKSLIILDADGKKEDPFQDKLILRINDYPLIVENNVDFYAKTFENESSIAENFNNESIHPIYTPGGPYDPHNQLHDKRFTKYFLDKMFLSFLKQNEKVNQIVYSIPEKFIENVAKINNYRLKHMDILNKMYKNENKSERLLGNECECINLKIDHHFQNMLDKMEYNEDSLNNYFITNVEQVLMKVCKLHKIDNKYYTEFLNKERDYFNSKKSNLSKQVRNYDDFKIKIQNAKSKKEKILCKLDEISRFVQDNCQDAANKIFWYVENNFKKIETYEGKIIDYINNHMANCQRFLQNPYIRVPSYLDYAIQNDISTIFEKLLEFKSFTFYRQHGIISRILHIFDKIEEKAEADHIAPGLWGIINTKTNKYCRILVEHRHYDVILFNLVNENVENEFLSNFNSTEIKSIKKHMKNNNCDHIIDLSNDQIDIMAKECAKLLNNKLKTEI